MLLVLYCLSGGVRRFNEMQRQIPDNSKKMLVQVLRSLESDGLVERTVLAVVPPKTEYRLTADGRKLHEPVAALYAWSIKNAEFLNQIAARRRRMSLRYPVQFCVARSGFTSLPRSGREHLAVTTGCASVTSALIVQRSCDCLLMISWDLHNWR